MSNDVHIIYNAATQRYWGRGGWKADINEAIPFSCKHTAEGAGRDLKLKHIVVIPASVEIDGAKLKIERIAEIPSGRRVIAK